MAISFTKKKREIHVGRGLTTVTCDIASKLGESLKILKRNIFTLQSVTDTIYDELSSLQKIRYFGGNHFLQNVLAHVITLP